MNTLNEKGTGFRLLKGSGVSADVPDFLRGAGFPGRLLVVGDENTMRAADGLTFAGFKTTERIYPDLRTADMRDVRAVEKDLENADGVIAVGSGSVHDICRLAAARADKPLALYATAPSMDGFASASAPITDGCFKISYPAKQPEVIIADTRVLARAPAYLKSAGFGDMAAKVIALTDWRIARDLVNEPYSEEIAALTLRGYTETMKLADRIQSTDEESAGLLFEALLHTGVAMARMGSSRPAAGAEHMLSHFFECIKLLDGEISDFHGKKVGVATLLILGEYKKLGELKSLRLQADATDYLEVALAYRSLAPEMLKANIPPITDLISPLAIMADWDNIRGYIAELPAPSEMLALYKKAGAATTAREINVSEELCALGMKYHAYFRYRLTLMRLLPMIREEKNS